MSGMELRSRSIKERTPFEDDDDEVDQEEERQPREQVLNQDKDAGQDSDELGRRSDALTDAFNEYREKQESTDNSEKESESGYADSDQQGSVSLGSSSTRSSSSEWSSPSFSLVSAYLEPSVTSSNRPESETEEEEEEDDDTYLFGQHPDVFENEEEERLEIAAIDELKTKDNKYQNVAGVSRRFIGKDGRKQYLLTWGSGETTWHYLDELNPSKHLLKAIELVDKRCNVNPNSHLFASTTPKVKGVSGGLKLFEN